MSHDFNPARPPAAGAPAPGASTDEALRARLAEDLSDAVAGFPRWVRRDLSSDTLTVREGAEGWIVAALVERLESVAARS